MITFRPYEAADLARVELQPAQADVIAHIQVPGYAASLAIDGHAWTGVAEDGRIVGCAGLIPAWPGYARAWALFGRIPPADWPRVVAKVRAVFRESGLRRIDTSVADGFGHGCRFAKIVGLRVEGMMRGYAPDGRDHLLYARVEK